MKLLKTIILTTILVLTAINLKAQSLYELYDYQIKEKDGTWQPLSGGTYITNGDDGMGYAPIGFNFTIDGRTYNYCYVSTNGYLIFGSYYSTWYPGPPGYYYNAGYQSIAWNGADLYAFGGVYIKTEGSAPNRVFTVQWNNIAYYGNYSVSMYAQIKLYETTNKVEIIYGPHSGPVGSTPGYAWISGRRVYPYGPAYNINPGSPSQYYKGHNYYERGMEY